MIEKTIADAVKQALAPEFEAIAARLAVLENPDVPKGKMIMDIDALCEYIRKKPQAIYRMTGKGEIPHSKKGKRLYFDKNAIDEWLMSNNTSPQQVTDRTEQYFNNKRGRVPQKKNRLR